MSTKTVLTDEERKQRKRESQRRYLEKQKLKAQTTVAQPDYENMYKNAVAEVNRLNEKIVQLENICKNYATQVNVANNNLKKATIEYNARVQYMLDCTKHAFLSMQFAAQASDKGEKSND